MTTARSHARPSQRKLTEIYCEESEQESSADLKVEPGQHRKQDAGSNRNKAEPTTATATAKPAVSSREQPTEEQLCLALKILKNKLPYRSLEQIILSIFKVFKQQQKYPQKDQQIQQGPLVVSKKEIIVQPLAAATKKKLIRKETMKKLQNSQEIDVLQLMSETEIYGYRTPETTKFYLAANMEITQFCNPEDRELYLQKKITGKAFIERDYGIAQARKQFHAHGLGNSLDRNRFKNLAGGAITHSYRNMERFLFTECKRTIPFLEREAMRSILTILLNIRHKLKADECETFFKFVAASFGLSDVLIGENETLRLYMAIMRNFYGKKITMAELEKIGDIRLKRRQELAKFYSEKRRRTNVKRKGRCQRYTEIVQSKLNNIPVPEFNRPVSSEPEEQTLAQIRRALNKVEKDYKIVKEQSEMPYMFRLTKNQLKFVAMDPQCKQLREQLIEYAGLQQNVDREKLFFVIISIREELEQGYNLDRVLPLGKKSQKEANDIPNCKEDSEQEEQQQQEESKNSDEDFQPPRSFYTTKPRQMDIETPELEIPELEISELEIPKLPIRPEQQQDCLSQPFQLQQALQL